LGVPSALILREIRAVRVISPRGRAVEIRAEEAKGLVLDRTGLNRWLRERAQEKGATLIPAAFRALRGETLVTTKGPVDFAVLVGADGARSGVARALGLPGPRELLLGVQAEVSAELGDTVEVHLGVVPDFFAWVVPAEEGLARVGLATKRRREAVRYLREFLARRFPRAPILSLWTGLIPIGPPARTVWGRVLLLGNAAAQVKPLTGGGLAFISLCAPIAGALAARGRESIPEYETTWRNLIGQEQSFEERARSMFLKLSPETLEQLVQAWAHPKIARILAEDGDIDAFASIPKRIAREPSLWPLLLSWARWLPREFFP
jgi:flavin-dependent dehydrogenase